MIDLKDLTFIIPVRIESEDRRINAIATLGYLCHNLISNIIIFEEGPTAEIPDILKKIKQNDMKIEYHFKCSSETLFHRTKFLNTMLKMVKTSVVSNYDIDTLLELHAYKKSYDLIKSGYDLVYPFLEDCDIHIIFSGKEKFIETNKLSYTNGYRLKHMCDISFRYGLCQFFNTKSYIEGGMENENFISWSPEDQERYYRFEKLGYKITRFDANVFHLEHLRGINSDYINPMFEKNQKLFDYIKSLLVEELRKYYGK